MTQIVIRLQGDGIERLARAAEAIGKRGKTAMDRGLIDGGRKTTTMVKRGLHKQTSIKKRQVDARVSHYFDAGRNAWVINGFGAGVDIRHVNSVSGGKYAKRDRKALRRHFARFQPRDSQGRFAPWGEDDRAYAEFLRRDLTNKPVTATVWGDRRTFWQSYRDRKAFRSIRDTGRHQTLYGPAVWKELTKDQSAAAFYKGAAMVEVEILRRLSDLSGGALS